MTSRLSTLVCTRLLAILLLSCGFSACLSANDGAIDGVAKKHAIDVPADTVENAIKKLSLQTGVDIIVPTKAVRGLRSNPVNGEYTAREALEIMVADTGLVVTQDARAGGLTVHKANAARGAKKNRLRASTDGENEAGGERASAKAQTVIVTGRVFNNAIGYYVKSAEVRVEGTDNHVYTEDGGTYSISVPSGPVTLVASYAGVQSDIRIHEASPGAANTVDFELRVLAGDSAAGAKDGEEIVQMDRFVVSEDRVGQGKAIMEQRAAINAKSVIATDNFGELTQGNIGEFLKYMPGITLDFGESEAAGVRIGGLDSKYTAFTTDGVVMATPAANRYTPLTTLSITGIESIEFNQTLTASMDAGAAAGNINLKSRYAFNIRKNTFRWQVSLDGTMSRLDFGRDYMPDDRLHNRIQPGVLMNYGGTFFNRRLGIEASFSRYATFNNQQMVRVNYAYHIGKGEPEFSDSPIVSEISWRPGPQFFTRTSGNLSVDYKFSKNLILSVRGNMHKNDGQFINQYIAIRAEKDYGTVSPDSLAPPAGYQPESSLIYWAVEPTSATSNDTRIYTNSSHRWNTFNSRMISPRLIYKKGSLNVELRGTYTKAVTNTDDIDKGFFRSANSRISGIGFTASRPDANSPSWTLVQTRGMDWSVPENWGRTTYDSALWSTPEDTKNTQRSGYLDITYAHRLFGHPVTFKAGGGVRRNDYTFDAEDNRYNYAGPTGDLAQTYVPWTQNYVYKMDFGNISDQNWRADNDYAMGSLFHDFPGYFIPDTIRNYARNILLGRSAFERVDAGYFEATTRVFRKVQLNAGVRFENTTTEAKITKRRTDAEIAAAKAIATQEEIDSGMFDGNASIAGINYRYYDGQRFTRKTNYDNVFLSGGLKYEITPSLRFQLSASQSILRPSFADVAGTIRYYDENYSTDIWVPNPNLKPERTTKYYAGLHYYLNPAGIVALSVFRLDIADKQISGINISTEQAESQVGYPLGEVIVDETTGDVVQNDITYRSTINVPGRRTVYGVTLEYNQQLTFLPGLLKGLSVFGSYSWSDMQNDRETSERIGLIDRSANGGIRYRYKRFNIQLRASWQDDSLKRVTIPVAGRNWVSNDRIYLQSRIVHDLSGGINLGNNLEFVFSVRNVLDAPLIYYSNVRGRMHEYYRTGAICSFSIKGSF
ncbi:TonB-dependent receptor domain-containing protein [Ereboglobus luteus]|uniref:Secretin/TonB short N-terminal domain-containing protein n=1 Tax=Ereboglobus luteus TaxID=1796921 RepID=A0A2U8E0Q1_9BACT|nr:TonB-dependent receptor [Ereboglobus luteus]AWI08162.1 hypothetical protein CKA38_01790 [Ereboglobus luteus]